MSQQGNKNETKPACLKAFEERIFNRAIPYRALLELTHKCNFRCVHCYLADHCRADELDTSGWIKILDNLKGAGVLYLTLSGGEFLMRPDHIELTRYAKKLGFVLRFFTNATLIDKKTAKFWKSEIYPWEVEVSFYGASEESYRQITGQKNFFEQTIHGMEKLADNNLKVLLKIIVLKYNVGEVEKMIAIAKKFGFDYRVSGKLSLREGGDVSPLKHRVPDELWHKFYECYETIRFCERGEPNMPPCTAGRTGLAVAPNGDVYPCVELRKPVGNLLNQPLSDFWFAHPFLTEVRRVKNKDFRFPLDMDYTKAVPPCMGLNFGTSGSLVDVSSLTAETMNSDIAEERSGEK